MGASLLWTLRSILFCVAVCKHTTELLEDWATPDVSQQSVYLMDTVYFKCSAHGEKQQKFYKDGTLVQEGSRHELHKRSDAVYLRISPVSESDGGLYSCGVSEERQSNIRRLSVTQKQRTVRVTPWSSVIPVGGSVTLSCDIEGFTGKYRWFRGIYPQTETLSETSQRVSVSRGGEYSCRGENDFIFTAETPAVTVKQTVSVTPNWSELLVGESLTLSCEVEGADKHWTYKWSRSRLNLPPTTREYTVSRVTESDTGAYSCRAQRGPHLTTVWNSSSTVSVLSRPQVTVSGLSEVQTGGSVVLLCSVSPLSSGWKYEWSRNEQVFKQSSSEEQVSVSEGGEYQCRASRGEPPYFTEHSPKFTVKTTDPRAPSLSVEPPWSPLFSGEQLTVTCRTHGADAEWTFEWRRSRMSLEHKQREVTLRAAVMDKGPYSCRGVRPHTVTEWSLPLTLHVSDRAPRPVLSVSVSWISPGASVSLSCAVTAPSAGWSFHWYRAVPQSQSYTYERLPGASVGSKQASFSLQGLKRSEAFVCRASRGSPAFFSEHSHPSFVWTEDVESPVSLSVSPDRTQHFTGDVITLSCGFISTEADGTVWRRFSDNTLSSHQCFWRTDKSKCEFSLSEETSAVFWCESGSGQMSSAINISVHRDIILLSPVRAVTEGRPVALSCKLHTGNFTSVRFYKNGKIIQNGTEPELHISAVSRSDEGFYKCEGQWKPWQRSTPNTAISPESWMSVKSAPRGFSLSVMWVVGPVCAAVLLITLLLLWRFVKTKDLCFPRTNQSSAEDHVINNDHASSSNDVTYSVLELKNMRERNNSAHGENVTYAQVKRHKKRQNKAKTTLDDRVYSQVKF